MTCPDVEQLLDAFVDTELPPPQLLDVARHAAGCAACDGAIRDLSVLRQSVAALVEREARTLDLSGVWPAIAAAMDAGDQHPLRPAARVLRLQRAVPTAPVWGALMALAASVFFWVSGPSRDTSSDIARPLRESLESARAETQVASAPRPTSGVAPARAMRPVNHAQIDRLSGKDIAVRREPKNGTTIIWVNHTVEDGR